MKRPIQVDDVRVVAVVVVMTLVAAILVLIERVSGSPTTTVFVAFSGATLTYLLARGVGRTDERRVDELESLAHSTLQTSMRELAEEQTPIP